MLRDLAEEVPAEVAEPLSLNVFKRRGVAA